MHLGQNNKCEDIFIEKWTTKKAKEGMDTVLEDKHEGKVKINDVSSQEYLGEILSSDGTNKLNIKKKVA